MKKLDILRKIIQEEIRNVLYEMSIRQIKDKVLELVKSDICLPYKIDEFTYQNIPLKIFVLNGITEFDLKSYEKSSDIITFNMDINFNPIKKDVDVFLQRKGIFGQENNMPDITITVTPEVADRLALAIVFDNPELLNEPGSVKLEAVRQKIINYLRMWVINREKIVAIENISIIPPDFTQEK